MAREELGARAHGAGAVPEWFYREAFARGTDCIIGLDARGRISAINPSACELVGYAREELIGREAGEFVSAEDVPSVPQLLAEVRERGSLVGERRLRCRDGRLVAMEFALHALPDGGAIGLARNTGDTLAVADRLRRSEKMMADIISFLPDATFAVDTGGVVIAWNHAMEVMTGVAAADMLGHGDREYSVPFYGERRPLLVDLVFAELEAATARYGDVRRSGGLLIAETHAPTVFGGVGATLWGIAAPLFNDAGECIGAIESIRDVTRQRQDREALRAGGALLHATLEAVADGILAVGARDRVLHWNQRFAEMWQVPAELLEQRDDERLITFVADQLEDPAAFRARVAELYVSRDGATDVMRFRDGRVLERASYPLMQDGELSGRVWSFRDVTARTRAEQAVQESERRYRVLFESAADAIFLMQDGRFVDCNERTLEVFRCTREQIVGDGPARFSPPRQPDGSDSLAGAEAHIAAALAGERQVFEWLHSHADGSPFDAEVSLTRVELASGPHLLAMVRDVTERRRAQEERLQLERRLLHSQKLESLGVLAGGIAHDFNNLLMAMQGNLELARTELAPGSAPHARLGDALRAVQRAADLTHQMLAYSGRGRFAVCRLDLSALVEENAHLFRASIAHTTTLALHLEPDLPSIEADGGQVQQVVMNLITNAAEAVGEAPGTIHLSTGVLECDEAELARSRLDEKPAPGRFAFLEVADTGCGMDAETQRRMFDPFFTTKLTGRGLGMAAVQGIVLGHHGALFLDSTPGRGTRVRVLFPLAGAAPPDEVPTPAPPAVAGSEPDGAPRGLVLLVDDEAAVRESSALLLEFLGFAVVQAVDGLEAVELMRARGDEIAVVLLDLTMPRLDGIAAIEEILAIRPEARIVLCSGYDEPDVRNRTAGRLAGFLAKPFDLEALESVLAQALRAPV